MKLLNFIAFYGMLLMPMGAVVFVDFWLMPKLKLKSYYAELKGIDFNWAAGLTWFLTLAACWYMVQFGGMQIFFVSLPGWFIAAILYIIFSALYQKEIYAVSSFRLIAQIASWASMIALVVVPVFYATGVLSLDMLKTILMIITIIWFVVATIWMWKKD